MIELSTFVQQNYNFCTFYLFIEPRPKILFQVAWGCRKREYLNELSQILFVLSIPDICHKHHKQCLWRKLLSCGEIFPYDRLSCREVSPHEKCEENLSHRESSPRDKCGAKCIMWRNVEKTAMWINVSTWQISPHEKWKMWRLSVFML